MRSIFVSYSHVDEPIKDRLVRHVRSLARKARIEVWDDRRIEEGEAWQLKIRQAIEQADVAILLVSADFLSSSFIQEHEVPLLLERRAQGTLQIVPLIVQPCNWADIDWLKEIQVYPRNAVPLSEKSGSEVERDLTKLARKIVIGRNPDPPPGSLLQRILRAAAGLTREAAWIVRTAGFALLPAILALGTAAMAMNLRVTTRVQLEVVARTASFTIGGTAPSQLLNNLTPFSQLTVDTCDAVHLPPIVVGVSDAVPVSEPRPVDLRCHRRIAGARVVLRPADGSFTGELGSLGSIAARPGEMVSLELLGVRPTRVRLQMAQRGAFHFEIEKEIPFEIVSEYAAAEGPSDPIGEDDVGVYRAILPAAGSERIARVEAGLGINVIVGLADNADPDAPFKPALDVPVESLSLFRRDDVQDALVSTTLRGRLTYPDRPDLDGGRIEPNDPVSLDPQARLRLTKLGVAADGEGLELRIEGLSSRVTIAGVDHRLTLFERSAANLGMMVLVAAVAALAQYSWLRKFGWGVATAVSDE